MAGKIAEVIDGVRKGQFCKLPNVANMKGTSLFAYFYSDENCDCPLVNNGKRDNGLIQPKMIRLIGFYD